MSTKYKKYLIIFLIFFTSGCILSRQTIRGSIIMKLEKEAHVSMGSRDKLKQNDIVIIYRTKSVPDPRVVPDFQTGVILPRAKYAKVKVGKARVIAILSEDYAAIELVEGEFEIGDIVEKISRWYP